MNTQLMPNLFTKYRRWSRHWLARSAFIAAAFVVLLHYFSWRLAAVQSLYDQSGFAVSAIVLGFEFCLIARLFALYLKKVQQYKRNWKTMPTLAQEWPEVSILIASDEEPEHILEVSLIAASQIDYPKDKLNIYLLPFLLIYIQHRPNKILIIMIHGDDLMWIRNHYSFLYKSCIDRIIYF